MHREVVPTERFFPHGQERTHFLFEGVTFPATHEELVEHVTDAELDTDTLNIVRALPRRTYESMTDVWRAFGEATRVFGLGSRAGRSRDDIGKSAFPAPNGVRQP